MLFQLKITISNNSWTLWTYTETQLNKNLMDNNEFITIQLKINMDILNI